MYSQRQAFNDRVSLRLARDTTETSPVRSVRAEPAPASSPVATVTAPAATSIPKPQSGLGTRPDPTVAYKAYDPENPDVEWANFWGQKPPQEEESKESDKPLNAPVTDAASLQAQRDPVPKGQGSEKGLKAFSFASLWGKLGGGGWKEDVATASATDGGGADMTDEAQMRSEIHSKLKVNIEHVCDAIWV